uniref:Bicarbonate transporter-like transmembrane domain-containing protein n=1 Tax=Micromonas pusilla TaxID=38833 RepID=A0A7S0NNA0_MICPS
MAGDSDMPNGKMEPDWKTGADGEAEIQCCVGFGAGIAKDFRRRRPLYGDDWSRGTGVGLKIFAPATYIFFASVLPALTFGEQFREETQELFSIPHILCATAIAGVLQSIFGGQPLLIVGVAEPIVLVYYYMFKYADGQSDLGPELFRPFCTWVLIFTALMHFVLAFANASEYINAFTRFSGETFGTLIALLFLQAAVKGLKDEFEEPHDAPVAYRMVNGIWSVFLATALVLLAIFLMGARKWHVGRPWLRALVADYGAFIAVIIITCVSYAVEAPDGVTWDLPIRVACKQIYDKEVTDTWKTTKHLGDVPAGQVGVALIPALIITVLFFFDHNVSAQLAQVDDFNLEKPPAYHYDFLLQGLNTLLLGLLGLPPTNGVLPQAPMHTRSLMGVGQDRSEPGAADIVLEQRMSNLIQSVLVGICLFISPVIKLMPRAVLWGYFVFMAIESFPGNQFIHRITLFVMDIQSLRRGESQPAYVDLVPMGDTQKFTVIQLTALGAVYGVTWAGVYGIAFPLLIMALVPLRQYLIVKWFPAASLRHLDTAEDVEETVEEDGPNVDHKLDKFAGGGVLDGAGAFVQKKHESPVQERMNRQ